MWLILRKRLQTERHPAGDPSLRISGHSTFIRQPNVLLRRSWQLPHYTKCNQMSLLVQGLQGRLAATSLNHTAPLFSFYWSIWLNVGKRDKDTLLSCPPPVFFISPFFLIPPLCVEPRVISVWSTPSASSRHIKLAEGGVGFSVFGIGPQLVCRYTSSSVKATPRQS